MGKQLKVCFAMFRAYPLFGKTIGETTGGSEVELYHLATYLAGLDNIQVDFIVGDYGQKDIEIINNIRFIKVRYMRLDKYQTLKHKLLRYVSLFKVLLKQKSQIYFTKTASELLGWMVLFLKFLKGKKVIFRLGSDKDADLEFWKQKRKLYSLYKFGLKYCDKVYVQSSNQKKMLRDNCGIDSQIIKNVFPISRESKTSKKDYILWVSRCEPLKRPELFIELARRVPKEKFLMIMPHEKKADEAQDNRIHKIINDVEQAAKELDNLEYIQSVPFCEIQRYYDAAKLFVNTSEYEGFPNSFIQSGLGRTGILSFRVNPDGFLDDYHAGFCCQDNMEKAVSTIKALTCEQIEALGRNACTYVEENHDIRIICQQYIRDFSRLADLKMMSEGVTP